jgi:hypothetical protein
VEEEKRELSLEKFESTNEGAAEEATSIKAEEDFLNFDFTYLILNF